MCSLIQSQALIGEQVRICVCVCLCDGCFAYVCSQGALSVQLRLTPHRWPFHFKCNDAFDATMSRILQPGMYKQERMNEVVTEQPVPHQTAGGDCHFRYFHVLRRGWSLPEQGL